MNSIDIFILLILAFAIYQGVKEGVIIQGLAIVGIAVGIWVGSKFGAECADYLNIKGGYSSIWGFAILVFVTVIALAIVARVLRKALQFAGFGLVDVVLGAALSMCKYLLVMSIVFTLFDYANHYYDVVDHKYIENSTFYRPIANITKWATPAWDWTQDQFKNI